MIYLPGLFLWFILACRVAKQPDILRLASVLLKVGISFAIRFVKQAEELGHLRPQTPKYSSKLEHFYQDIMDWLSRQPDLALQEISTLLLDQHGLKTAISTLHVWLCKNKISSKKTAHAAEQERPDLQRKRRVFRKRQDWVKSRPNKLKNLVFIDETGVNTKMARPRGRCTRGKRLVAAIPHGHWKTLTFIAGLRHDRITAPWGIDDPMNGDIFVEYIKHSWRQALGKGIWERGCGCAG